MMCCSANMHLTVLLMLPSCLLLQAYSQLEGGSHVVNTAWAMMALLAAGYHTIDPKPLHKCVQLLPEISCPPACCQPLLCVVFKTNLLP